MIYVGRIELNSHSMPMITMIQMRLMTVTCYSDVTIKMKKILMMVISVQQMAATNEMFAEKLLERMTKGSGFFVAIALMVSNDWTVVTHLEMKKGCCEDATIMPAVGDGLKGTLPPFVYWSICLMNFVCHIPLHIHFQMSSC